MVDKKREAFVDFVYNMFPDDDDIAERIVSKFNEVTELPYKVGETVYFVNECVGNCRYVGIFKDVVNSVTIRFSRKGITYDIKADFVDFKVSDNGIPDARAFKKFSEAKHFAQRLSEKLNVEIIAFS